MSRYGDVLMTLREFKFQVKRNQHQRKKDKEIMESSKI